MARAFEAERLEFGCNVRGVSAADLQPQDMAEIKDLLYRHRLIVLKDQTLNEEQYCDFARAFGEPVPYLQENYRHPDYPLIFVSSNVKTNGKKIGVARTGGYWHSDTAFEPDPKYITMLMPKVMPPAYPRSTLFIDMAAVYAALPQATKDEIEGARFVHSGRWRYKVREEDLGKDIHEILKWVDDFAPQVEHPAVITHPYTREKVLYGTSGFTVGIANTSLDRSKELLAEIFAFAESSRFVRSVRWLMGDLIIWDNRFLAHCSDRNEGLEEPTEMHRITLKDGYPLCASQMTLKDAA